MEKPLQDVLPARCLLTGPVSCGKTSLLMAILGRQAGLVGQKEVLLLGAVMVTVGIISWQIGEHYKEERKVSWRWKLYFYHYF